MYSITRNDTSDVLGAVEVTARAGLKNLAWSIAGELKLPSFEDPKELLWPRDREQRENSELRADCDRRSE